jgi:hypothetical protein
LRCYDHKNKSIVAIKINRNTPFDHNNSRVEIGILRKLKNGYTEDDDICALGVYKSRVI